MEKMAFIKNPYLTASFSSGFAQQIINLIPGITTVYNIKTGKYVFVNNSIKTILGYDPLEILEKGVPFISSKVHPDDFLMILEKNSKAIQKENDPKTKSLLGPIVNFEYRIKKTNGEWCWLQTFGTVFNRDKDGKVEHILNVSFDITERKKIEEKVKQKEQELSKLNSKLEQIVKKRTVQLRDSEARLQEAQRITNMGSWEYDLKTGKISWSDTLFDIHGLDKDKGEPEYEEFLKLFLSPDCLKEKVDLAVKEGSSYKLDLAFKKPDGQIRYLQAIGQPKKNRSGEVIKLYGTAIDVTERKLLERQKDEFISIASHELKTPITTIKSFTQILKMHLNQSKGEKADYYLSKMENEINRLTILVNDLLDVSKLKVGKLNLLRERVDLGKLAEEIVEDMQAITKTHKIILKSDRDLYIDIDKYRINQVLINLISNAVKYSPKADKVLVTINKTKDSVSVEVQDFGIGISKKDQQKVFESFYQVNNRIRGSFSGLGLGLYICKEIISRHNGVIWVESVKKEGSTFKFALPLSYEKDLSL